MKQISSDILIVGGGMTGLLTALALTQTKNNIVIIDKNNIDQIPHSYKDIRTTAISQGSKKFLEKIFFWERIKNKSQPIKKIKVFDRNANNKINFFNSEKKDPLGYIVKNTLIKNEIIKILKTKRNITIFEKEDVRDLFLTNEYAKITTNKKTIVSKLIVAADGKFGSLKKILNTKQITKNYDHKAFVANFNHSKDHKNTAYEIFYKSGPLAILPMIKTSKNFYSSSLIWTNEKEYVNNLNLVNTELKKDIIEEKLYKYVGSILNIVDTKLFSLSAHINKKFYDKRLIYIGDSAHSIHPIAGQGWNVGVRDIENILNVITNAEKIGFDIGSKKVCKDYNDLSFNDAFSLFQITDKLNSIFLFNDQISLSLRKHGFKLIEKDENLKKYITNYAMGL